MARPSKLTSQSRETITCELAAGASTAATARAAGVSSPHAIPLAAGGRDGAGVAYQQLVADVGHAKRQARQRGLDTIGGAVETVSALRANHACASACIHRRRLAALALCALRAAP